LGIFVDPIMRKTQLH